MRSSHFITPVAVASMALLPATNRAAAQTANYKKDLPAALTKQAKISEDVAAKTALARVSKGEIQAVELEQENGKLIYSYDIKVPGKSGIDEVAVSAEVAALTSGKMWSASRPFCLIDMIRLDRKAC